MACAENVLRARPDLLVDGLPRGRMVCLPALEAAGLGRLSRLPHSIRIMLESLIRNLDGHRVQERHVRELAAWSAHGQRDCEIPFIVSRIVMPDSSGIPLLADLAAMRDAAVQQGVPAHAIEPCVPVDLIVDHSVVMDRTGTADALEHNMALEFERNGERYSFLKWAAQAFDGFRIHPPGTGIIHQVNLERLARGVQERDGVFHFDTLVGTDSHTTMINGIGGLGWGVGGIEGEAAMLGLPVHLLTPDVVGIELRGKPGAGVTSTDIVLTIVQRLRALQVVGKFVEFFGAGAENLSAPDRATIANMAPEYGATVAFFPLDMQTLAYLRSVGRTEQELSVLKAYFTAQAMFGMPRAGELDYSAVECIDLAAVVPCVAGPSRPQDRIALTQLKVRAGQWLGHSRASGMSGQAAPVPLRDGDVVIAAITSCTNTSNPGAMLAAGALAKKACQLGLRVASHIKTSFAPGSRTVSEYLHAAGLQPYLDLLGFQVAGYGCASCMGNTGPLDAAVEAAIVSGNLSTVAVLSGNRNFEARIHPAVKGNFLASPPLVIAFALAGRMDIDFDSEPLGTGVMGQDIFLRDIWPGEDELAALMPFARDPGHVAIAYTKAGSALWDQLPAPGGRTFAWNPASTYLQRPPFLESIDGVSPRPGPLQPLRGARALAIVGDSFTTDHISPGSVIPADSDSGRYLASLGVHPDDFSSYVTRRANHHVMVRGTFANVRIRNQMAKGALGGFTSLQPGGELMSIHSAATAYSQMGVPCIVFAGQEYGTGSSRDWAAKGSQLLGVRVVVAQSFERIHRSNLVGMGILPCEFSDGESVQSLGIDGTESFDFPGLEQGVRPRQMIEMIIRRTDGSTRSARLLARIDTLVEQSCFTEGGILPHVFRQLVQQARTSTPQAIHKHST